MPARALWLLTLSIMLAGCRTVPVWSQDGRFLYPPEKGLVAAPASPIPDLAMPIGFDLVETRSDVRVVGDARFVKHLYEGRARGGDLERFYRYHASRAGWALQNSESIARHETLMTFTKGPEDMTLRIDASPLRCEVIVTIQHRTVPAPSDWPTTQTREPSRGQTRTPHDEPRPRPRPRLQ